MCKEADGKIKKLGLYVLSSLVFIITLLFCNFNRRKNVHDDKLKLESDATDKFVNKCTG